MNPINHIAWRLYLLGALLTLIYKWVKYVHIGMKQGRTFKAATLEWFELVTVGSRASWATTIGVVWVIGTVYINRIAVGSLFGGFLNNVPVFPAFAFLLGSIAEMIAPDLVKFIVSKISGITKSGD
jgi:magnesium-transporting ATPase (P-type)